jgi:hypothetical protein
MSLERYPLILGLLVCLSFDAQRAERLGLAPPRYARSEPKSRSGEEEWINRKREQKSREKTAQKKRRRCVVA